MTIQSLPAFFNPQLSANLAGLDLHSALRLIDIDISQIKAATSFSLFGHNPAIAAADENLTAMGGLYTFLPVTGIGVEVVSASANDTAAGTGARTVRITGLEAGTLEKVTETITLNGVTAVPSVRTNWMAVNQFEVLTAGSGGTNAGDLDVRNLADTPVYSRIEAGASLAHQGIYTVPANKIVLVTTVNVAFLSGAGTGAFAVYKVIKYSADYSVTSVVFELGIAEYNSPFQFDLFPPAIPNLARSRIAPRIFGAATPQSFGVLLRGFEFSL